MRRILAALLFLTLAACAPSPTPLPAPVEMGSPAPSAVSALTAEQVRNASISLSTLTGDTPITYLLQDGAYVSTTGSAAITLVVVASVLPYLYAIDAWRAQVRASARAEADALQARIRPHFLFNSMNTIASLTRSDPARAEEAVQDLADLFRANLSEQRAQITLADELEVAGIYERIEKLRLGARLRVDWRTGALPRDAMVPSLLIQPLLENAIYHGIEPRRDGGTVTVQGEFAHGLITLVVRNPMPEGAVVRDGNRLALANIRERLTLMYDERATIKAGRFDDEYIVTLRFPYLPLAQVSAA